MFKFCESGDKKIVVGTGIRPKQWCRDCYVAKCGPEFEAWQVTEQVARAEDVDGIACAKTGETISGGGTVWLDPVETNIPALVYSGFIEPAEAPKAAAKAAKTEG